MLGALGKSFVLGGVQRVAALLAADFLPLGLLLATSAASLLSELATVVGAAVVGCLPCLYAIGTDVGSASATKAS